MARGEGGGGFGDIWGWREVGRWREVGVEIEGDEEEGTMAGRVERRCSRARIRCFARL